jgi:LytR cell envelope-related transcriptional attenuator
MIAPPLALSLSSSLTTIGALAAFAALLGIAVLSLLVFSQAREIKRLREWAGRAPERAAELGQRVSAQAAAHLQREGAPAGAVRVTPRTTPLVSAPVSSAVQASAAAATGSHPLAKAPSVPAGATPIPSVPAGSAIAAQGTQVGEPTVIAPPDAAGVSNEQIPVPAGQAAIGQAAAGQAAAGQPGSIATGEPAAIGKADQPSVDSAEQPPALDPALYGGAAARPVSNGGDDMSDPSHASDDMSDPTAAGDETTGGDVEGSVDVAPPPATAAALAARSPLPPPPPKPPAVPAVPLRTGEPLPQSAIRRAPIRPPAPGATSRRAPARTTSPSRSSSAGPASRRTGQAGGGATSYYKQQRSPLRATALIVGAAIGGVLLIVLIVSALKGGSGPGPSRAGQASPLVQAGGSRASSHHERAQAASSPSELPVVVLNGTSTAGLAHHLASDLQQGGYGRAEASAAVPPGSHPTTVVEYKSGHRADGQAVAKALNVTQVQPIDSSTAKLAPSAAVLVLAGADQAAQLGGGGTHSAGEPASGSGASEAGGGTGAAAASGASEAPATGAGEAAGGVAH